MFVSVGLDGVTDSTSARPDGVSSNTCADFNEEILPFIPLYTKATYWSSIQFTTSMQNMQGYMTGLKD